jgi:hypothetical protein
VVRICPRTIWKLILGIHIVGSQTCYPYIFALQEKIEEFGTHSGDVLMVLGVNVIISAISILEY